MPVLAAQHILQLNMLLLDRHMVSVCLDSHVSGVGLTYYSAKLDRFAEQCVHKQVLLCIVPNEVLLC